jgi:peptidoglycan/LPS O-acetylase OafA/YrhL
MDSSSESGSNKITNLSHIDLLRGLAILLVIFTHVSQSQKGLSQISLIVFDFGKIGVQLFFFLSAYTLCLSMTARQEKGYIRNFYIRRFFRIAPLYYVGILTYFLLSTIPYFTQGAPIAVHRSYTQYNVLCNVFFIHGLVPSANNSIVPGGWSIGTEMLFYLLFPFLFILCGKIKTRFIYALPLFALILANLFMFLVYIFDKSVFKNTFYYYNILNQLPVFIICISFFFLEKTWFSKCSAFISLIVFGVFFTLSFLLMYLFKHNINLAVFMAAVSFIFLFILFRNASLKPGLLNRIGQLSYSIYIFHFLFAYPLIICLVHLVNGRINPYILYGISLILTIGLSTFLAMLSEKFIEKRGINWGKSLIKH